MTSGQRELAHHALGLGRAGNGRPRNYFVTGKYSPDYAEWQAMVDAGWATARRYALSINDTVFQLTPAGEQVERRSDGGRR